MFVGFADFAVFWWLLLRCVLGWLSCCGLVGLRQVFLVATGVYGCVIGFVLC